MKCLVSAKWSSVSKCSSRWESVSFANLIKGRLPPGLRRCRGLSRRRSNPRFGRTGIRTIGAKSEDISRKSMKNNDTNIWFRGCCSLLIVYLGRHGFLQPTCQNLWRDKFCPTCEFGAFLKKKSGRKTLFIYIYFFCKRNFILSPLAVRPWPRPDLPGPSERRCRRCGVRGPIRVRGEIHEGIAKKIIRL